MSVDVRSRHFHHAGPRPPKAGLAALCGAAGLLLALANGCWHRTPAGSAPGVAAYPPLPAPPKKVHIAAVGDVLLDRGVWRRIEENGVHHVMKEVRDRLRSADLTFANLECPLSTVQRHARYDSDLAFCADPDTVQVLLDGGIDIVALANNHVLDAGAEGAEDTMRVLEENGIAYAGATPAGMDPEPVTYLPVGETTVAFLAYADVEARQESMGEVDEDMGNVLTPVSEAANNADVVCVSYHWGLDFHERPTERQKRLGHATIDAGADIVLGHHPHVMGGVEAYNDGLILYSMGNFVFDQREAADGRMNSAIFNLHVTVGERIDLVIVPLRIPRRECAPRLPSEERGSEILAGLADLSAELGTDLAIEGQKAKATFVLPGTSSSGTAGPVGEPG